MSNREMNNEETNNIIVEHADIRWLNFSGREGKFNPAGKRNFALFMDEEMAKKLTEDGWNVRSRIFEDVDRPTEYYISVEVNYDYYRPPRVTLIQGKKGIILDEANVGILDTVAIQNADVVIRPRYWEVNGKSGIKAYLHTLRIEAEEEYFAEKDDDIIFS